MIIFNDKQQFKRQAKTLTKDLIKQNGDKKAARLIQRVAVFKG